jgi:hypothetical protein
MKKKKFGISTLSAALLANPVQNVTYAASDDQVVEPYGYVCEPGWAYRNPTKQKSLYFSKKFEGTHYINKTGSNITYTSTISGSGTLGVTASASLGGGWGPINASVGYTANLSFTISASDAVSITIRPHYEGWNDYGTKKDQWYGYYVYVNSSCNESSGSK